MSAALWAAVDRLTRPSLVPVERAADADWLAELGEETWGACSVPAYLAATVRRAKVPSLWEQSTYALTTGSESAEGGASPLRERSPADLDLMEIRSIIRGTTRHELEQRGVRTVRGSDGTPTEFDPEEVRELARLVANSGDLWWWEYRFASWGRLLEGYLHAAEHKAKPVRIRNTPCPLCRTEFVRIETDDGEAQIVRPLIVDFRGGYVRAARCEACSATWFRGAELHQLADLIGVSDIRADESA